MLTLHISPGGYHCPSLRVEETEVHYLALHLRTGKGQTLLIETLQFLAHRATSASFAYHAHCSHKMQQQQ